jgi:hypothetical protein
MTDETTAAKSNALPGPIRFDRKLEVLCPVILAQAVGLAAARKQQRASEWVRAAIRVALHTEGVDIADVKLGV